MNIALAQITIASQIILGTVFSLEALVREFKVNDPDLAERVTKRLAHLGGDEDNPISFIPRIVAMVIRNEAGTAEAVTDTITKALMKAFEDAREIDESVTKDGP